MNPNEKMYRNTAMAIGFAMMTFFLLFQIYSVAITFLSVLLSLIPNLDPVAFDVIYQLFYGAGYLFCFMAPVLFLSFFLRVGKRPIYPMYALPKVSPWLPLILCSAIAINFAMANINYYFVDLIGYYDSSIMESMMGTSEATLHGIVLQFIVVCLVPGFCEEFLFRGAILTNLLPFGRTNAIMISAFLFGMMHQNAGQFLYTFALGIVLGIIYERTHSIWSCVIIHTMNNFLSILQSILVSNINDELLASVWLTVMEATIYLLGAVSTLILVFFFYFKRKERFASGFFGKTMDACDGYAEYPISRGAAVKYFLNPPMLVFLLFAAGQMLLLILLTVLIP